MQGTPGLPGQANLVSLPVVFAGYLEPGQVPCLSWLSHVLAPDVASMCRHWEIIFFPSVCVVDDVGQKRPILAF